MGVFIIIVAIVVIVAIFSSSKKNNPYKEIIEQRKNLVASHSSTARIIVNNGTHLFFMDDAKQAFGVDDSGTTYSYSGIKSFQTGNTFVSICHKDSMFGLELGKSNCSKEGAEPIDRASISLITNALLPIVRKNIHNELKDAGITPTHEYVSRGNFWGCDINSHKFYFTCGYLHICDFSKLVKIEFLDFSHNPSYLGCSYRIYVTIKGDDGTDDDEWINIDDRSTSDNLLAMFKGIKNRQGTPAPSRQLYNTITAQPYGSADNIDGLSGVEFEQVCQRLVEKMGFSTQTTKASGDGGIDLIAFNYQPLLSGKYIIQCKRYAGSVGEPIIRDLYGVVMSERANKGILMTTGHFTKSALAFAEGKPLELIDGTKMKDLLRQYNLSGGNHTYTANTNYTGVGTSSNVGARSSFSLSSQIINFIGTPGSPGVKRLQEQLPALSENPNDVRTRCRAVEALHGSILVYLRDAKDDISGLHEASNLLYRLISPLLTSERKNSSKIEDRFLYYVSLTAAGESLFWQGKLFEGAKLWKEVLDDWVDLKGSSLGAAQYRAELMMSICSTLSLLGKTATDSMTQQMCNLSALENAQHYGEMVVTENQGYMEQGAGPYMFCILTNNDLVERLVNVTEKPTIIQLGLYGHNEKSRLLCDEDTSLDLLAYNLQAEVDDDGRLTLRDEDSAIGSSVAEDLGHYVEDIYLDARTYFKAEQ